MTTFIQFGKTIAPKISVLMTKLKKIRFFKKKNAAQLIKTTTKTLN